MGLVTLYSIFAITTAIISLSKHFIPAMRYLSTSKEDKIQMPIVAAITYTLLAILAAPIVFIAVILPRTSEKYYSGLIDGLTKK